MDLRQLVILALQISIVATVFGFGLKAGMGDVLYLVRRPALLAKSLLAMLIVMPTVAVVLAIAFDFVHVVEVALVALSVSPTPPLLPRKERQAGGRAYYGLSLMTTMAVLAIPVIPLAAVVLGFVFGRSVAMAPGPIAWVVGTMILAPLAGGMALRAFAPDLARRVDRPVLTLARILLPVAIVPLLFVALQAAWTLVGNGTIFVIVIFALIGLGVGHVLGGPDPDHAVVLALSTSSRHPAIAVALARANFPEEEFGGTILLYLLVSTLVSIPYIAWFRKRRATSAALAT